MNTRLIIIVLFVGILLTSCNQKYPEKYAHLLKTLEGEWEEAPGIGFKETWERNRLGLEGAGYVYSGDSFSKTEDISIFIEGDSSLSYVVNVQNQNSGKTILFPLQSFTDSSLVFMNPYHDFPNVIAYNFISEKNLNVRLESLTEPERNFSIDLKKTGN